MKKDKVFVVSNSYWNLVNFRLNLIRNLNNVYEVYLIAKKDKYYKNKSIKNFNKKKLFILAHNKNFLFEIFTIFNMFYLLFRIRPNFILTFTAKPNLYFSLISFFFNVKLICNVTGYGALKGNSKFNKILFKIYTHSFSYNYMNFFQNKHDFEKINKSINKLLLPGSGVDLKKFSFKHKRKKLYTDFTMISRIFDQKGIQHFLNAVKYFSQFKKYSNLRFNLIGPIIDNKYHNIISSITSNNFHYYGMVDDLISFYNDANFIIYPSYYSEGTPRVLLESMSTGTPIISTDTIGCKQLFNLGFKIGFCAKKNDTSSLINVIKKSLKLDKDEYKQLCKEARGLVESRFDEKIIINKYLNVMNKSL